MRPREQALAKALDQLRQGVPLNWTQMEDDPELAVLASLQSAALLCREQSVSVPPDLRRELLEELSARLPTRKPDPEEARRAARPKSLAGFSESVYVPSQAEEDVPPLTPTLLPRVLMVGGALAGLALLFWITSWAVAALRPTPTYTWISARKSGQALFPQRPPANWVAPSCAGFSLDDPAAKRDFITLPDKNQLQLNVGFDVQFLPTTLPLSATYTLRLTDQAVSPCVESVPDPADPGAVVKLNYVARRQTDPNSADIAALTVFESKRLPAAIDVGSGQVEEVIIGGAHGIYWRGGPYQDLEGTHWIGDVSVMLVEQGDMVMVFVGEVRQGISKEMLTGLMRQMEDARQREATRPIPTFTWIQVRKGDSPLGGPRILGERRPATNAAELDCGADSRGGWNSIRGDTSTSVQQYAGFPVMSLPETVTLTGTIQAPIMVIAPSSTPWTQIVTGTNAVLTFTTHLISGSVRPCGGGALQPDDPGARVKQRYAARQTSSYFDGVRQMEQTAPATDIVTFQMQRQPVQVDVADGSWEEVRAGDAHGIFWAGSPYRDMGGVPWTGDVGVLAAEKGDTVLMLMGSVDPGSISGGGTQIQGVTRGLLVALLMGMK